MKLTATKTVALTGKNGRRLTLTGGHKLTPAQANNLTQRQVEAYTQPTQSSKSVSYNHEERVVILEAYVGGANRAEVAHTFFQAFPNSGHPTSSLNRMCGQLECLDNTHPNSTNHVVSKELSVLANSTYPERFMATPLLAMLDQVSIQDLVNLSSKDLEEALALAN
jgi:hypothetical protein